MTLDSKRCWIGGTALRAFFDFPFSHSCSTEFGSSDTHRKFWQPVLKGDMSASQ